MPRVVYSSEMWSLSVQEKRKLEVCEMLCLRNIQEIKRSKRVRNSLIRERYDCELSA